jgi:hypothetical protein
MPLYFSGSDGNIYVEPYNGAITGSLYKTKFVTLTDSEEEEDYAHPGILYNTSTSCAWNCKWSAASLMDSSTTFNTSSLVGCVWVYDINQTTKSIIESDSNWVATYVTSSL